MKNREHTGLNILSDDDRILDESAETIVEALLENLEKECLFEIEPYELYVKMVRVHLLNDLENYAQRLVKGHLAILKEIKSIDQTTNNQ